jgi:hypothetical protein
MLHRSKNHHLDWNTKVFPLYCEVGMDVRRTLINLINSKNTEPTKSGVTIRKRMREIMTTRLWRKNTIEEIARGKCGPHIQKCMHEVHPRLHGLIRYENPRNQHPNDQNSQSGPSPHYPIQDILLMKQLVLMGLIHNYGLGHEREMEENPHIKILFLIGRFSQRL